MGVVVTSTIQVCALCGGPLGNPFYVLMTTTDFVCAACVATEPEADVPVYIDAEGKPCS